MRMFSGSTTRLCALLTAIALLMPALTFGGTKAQRTEAPSVTAKILNLYSLPTREAATEARDLLGTA